MEIDSELLRELARLKDEGRTVLSCYLALDAGGWDAIAGFIDEERARIEPALTGEEREFLELALALLTEFTGMKREQGTKAPGLAFFAALGDGFSRGVELPARPQPLLAIDSEAVLAPLAFQVDEHPGVGVVIVDNSGARLLLVAGDLVEDADAVKGDVKNAVKVGGWSQARYQRRRGNQMKELAAEVAQRVAEVFGEAGVERVVLAGRQQMIATAREALPKEWSERVIGEVAVDVKAGDQALLDALRPLIESAERREEQELIADFIGEVRRGGLAVAGVGKTRWALEMAAVDVLLVGDRLSDEEREELVARAQATGAAVEFFPENQTDSGPAARLAGFGSVGALLRFPVPSGKRSGSAPDSQG